MKPALHPRSLHNERYDFDRLIQAHPALKNFVRPHPIEGGTVDFSDPLAVKALNVALLKHYYKISWWDIPQGHLCPPIPGRADYIHALADLLQEKRGPEIRVLDVGIGANCIYPLLGHQIYQWNFIGSDVSQDSLKSAQKIIEANSLTQSIELRWQPARTHIFQGIIKPTDRLTATLCNPPFHASAKEAAQQSFRKRKNLGQERNAPLNFGGMDNELWCDGGELKFITRMIDESREFRSQCNWFTTLVSKEDNLARLVQKLRGNKVREHSVIEQAQGQKKSRILAWRF